jgi:hypothetical protein
MKMLYDTNALDVELLMQIKYKERCRFLAGSHFARLGFFLLGGHARINEGFFGHESDCFGVMV